MAKVTICWVGERAPGSPNTARLLCGTKKEFQVLTVGGSINRIELHGDVAAGESEAKKPARRCIGIQLGSNIHPTTQAPPVQFPSVWHYCFVCHDVASLCCWAHRAHMLDLSLGSARAASLICTAYQMLRPHCSVWCRTAIRALIPVILFPDQMFTSPRCKKINARSLADGKAR